GCGQFRLRPGVNTAALDQCSGHQLSVDRGVREIVYQLCTTFDHLIEFCLSVGLLRIDPGPGYGPVESRLVSEMPYVAAAVCAPECVRASNRVVQQLEGLGLLSQFARRTGAPDDADYGQQRVD